MTECTPLQRTTARTAVQTLRAGGPVLGESRARRASLDRGARGGETRVGQFRPGKLYEGSIP